MVGQSEATGAPAGAATADCRDSWAAPGLDRAASDSTERAGACQGLGSTEAPRITTRCRPATGYRRARGQSVGSVGFSSSSPRFKTHTTDGPAPGSYNLQKKHSRGHKTGASPRWDGAPSIR